MRWKHGSTRDPLFAAKSVIGNPLLPSSLSLLLTRSVSRMSKDASREGRLKISKRAEEVSAQRDHLMTHYSSFPKAFWW